MDNKAADFAAELPKSGGNAINFVGGEIITKANDFQKEGMEAAGKWNNVYILKTNDLFSSTYVNISTRHN